MVDFNVNVQTLDDGSFVARIIGVAGKTVLRRSGSESTWEAVAKKLAGWLTETADAVSKADISTTSSEP